LPLSQPFVEPISKRVSRIRTGFTVPSAPPILDPLKLAPQECERLISEMNATAKRAPAAKGGEQRRDARLPIQTEAVMICRTNPGAAGSSQFAVKCRNISRSGLSFLHGFYLHSDTPCEIILINHRREGFKLVGQVVRCRHLRENVHEVGLRFDEPMDICEVLGE
jgi:hypothetical protein